MFSKSLFIATIVISATSHPIFAQPLEVSILEPTKTRSAEFSPNARALQFPGRDSNVNSSAEAQR
jgi:hypothetical protein